MTQCNSLNVKLSNSQLNKFKSAIKNETEVVLRLSSNIIGDNERNVPHKLLLTDIQVSNLRKVIKNSIIQDYTIRRISWKITWSITKNRISINKKRN